MFHVICVQYSDLLRRPWISINIVYNASNAEKTKWKKNCVASLWIKQMFLEDFKNTIIRFTNSSKPWNGQSKKEFIRVKSWGSFENEDNLCSCKTILITQFIYIIVKIKNPNNVIKNLFPQNSFLSFILFWQSGATMIYVSRIYMFRTTGCPKKHGNSVTNWISSLLWISIVIPNFKSHNINSFLCLYTVIFLFY